MVTERHTAEQIIAKLREAEVELAKCQPLAEPVRKPEISEQTYYRWRKAYGGLRVDQAKRLKKLVADQALDNAVLKEVASGNF